MSGRQFVNKNPKITAVAVGIIIMTIGAWAYWSGRGAPATSASLSGQAYFSIDDGKNWFVDDVKKIPPFQKDGKQALRAYVYKCADGKLFVPYVGRYTPQAKQELEANYARDPERPNQLVIRQLELDGLEVKPPGQTTWLKRADPRAAGLTMPKCADGTDAQLVVP